MDQPSQDPIRDNPATVLQGVGDTTIHGGTFNAIQGNATFNTFFHANNNAVDPLLKKPALLKQMPSNNFTTYHQNIVTKRAPGTGDIFKETKTVTDWVRTRGSRLWCYGHPGAGKTYKAYVLDLYTPLDTNADEMFTRSIIVELTEERARHSKDVAFAFAYLQFSSHLKAWDIIMAFIRQIFQRTTSVTVILLVEAIFKKYENSDGRPSLDEVGKLLQNILNEYKDQFISLDGLDELEGDERMALLNIILTLKANIVIFSRPLNSLKTWMKKFQPAHFDIVAGDLDLDLFIEHVIDKTPDFGDLLDEHGLKEETIAKVKKQAGGMFLHAALHMEALRVCTCPQEILEETEQFPSDIKDLYANTLNRIEKQPEKHLSLAKRVLIWLLNVQGPFSIDDLRYAIAASPTTFSYEPRRMVSADMLISVCLGLAVVDDQSRQVRLIHYTAYEILPNFLSSYCPRPHDMITRTCLSRLIDCGFQRCTLKRFGQRRSAFQNNPLLEYSHSTIPHHIRQADPSNPSIQQITDDFVRQSDGYPYLNLRDAAEDWELLQRLSPLHVAVLFDLPKLIMCLIEDGISVNIRTTWRWGSGWTSLMLASREGNESLVATLLDFPEIELNAVDFGGFSALHLASFYGHAAVVDRLIRCVDTRLEETRTSSTSGLPRIDVNLVENQRYEVPRIEVNLVSNHGCSALLMASQFGYKSIVKILLGVPGIRMDQVDMDGDTALSVARVRNHESIVKLLEDFASR